MEKIPDLLLVESEEGMDKFIVEVKHSFTLLAQRS